MLDVGEYLNHKRCKCKQMIDQLVEKCSENIDENEMIYNRTLRVVLVHYTLYYLLYF